VRTKVMTVMRWYAQDELNQEESEHNEVDIIDDKNINLQIKNIKNMFFFTFIKKTFKNMDKKH